MRNISTNELRELYQQFFEGKGHTRIPSAPLVPENDPTTLFTGSGMQPLVPYLLGEPHPQGKRLVNSQKSFRAEDIEEIGDNRHTTFFEMLGNWSLGDYFKEEQLSWIFEFLTEVVELDPRNLYVTVFAGDKKANIPRDTESVEIWKRLFQEKGIEARDSELLTPQQGGREGMQGGRIFYFGASKNWWSRAGLPENMPPGEPGGPDSEIFYDFGAEHNSAFGEHCHPNCDCGRFMEIGNSVFMEFVKQADGSFVSLPQKNVDFGGGLERMVAAAQHTPDIFSAVDPLRAIIEHIENTTHTTYQSSANKASYRIMADHMRAVTLLIGDGVAPSNTDRGYVVRRLIRRAAYHAQKLAAEDAIIQRLANVVADQYASAYPDVKKQSRQVGHAIREEVQKFGVSLRRALVKLETILNKESGISGAEIFELNTAHGLPLDAIWDRLKERNIPIGSGVQEDVRRRIADHREKSRTAGTGKFKGGLADHSEKSVHYHTATHLLHQALRDVLGEHVFQKGSNITPERLRFDFSHTDKMTPDQIQKIENLVNQKIQEDLLVLREETTVAEAKQKGALGLFEEKYADRVSVYSMGNYSCEICGGPHVAHTGELGHFKITKEESAGAGVRRIKAVLE
ncbi:MAG: alanine--tRNA ligase [Patescibacteria group bacterium]